MNIKKAATITIIFYGVKTIILTALINYLLVLTNLTNKVGGTIYIIIALILILNDFKIETKVN